MVPFWQIHTPFWNMSSPAVQWRSAETTQPDSERLLKFQRVAGGHGFSWFCAGRTCCQNIWGKLDWCPSPRGQSLDQFLQGSNIPGLKPDLHVNVRNESDLEPWHTMSCHGSQCSAIHIQHSNTFERYVRLRPQQMQWVTHNNSHPRMSDVVQSQCRTMSNPSEVLMSEGKAQLWSTGGMNGWKDLLCLSSMETATTALKDLFLWFGAIVITRIWHDDWVARVKIWQGFKFAFR